MKWKRGTFVFAAGICFCLLSVGSVLGAQQTAATLAGTVSSSSGQPIANAKVSAKNLSTRQSSETQSDSEGKYKIANLATGDYAVSVQIAGFSTKTSNISLTSASPQTLDFTLTATEVPNAPSPVPASPSLQDLGFSAQETQANPQLQAP